MMIRMAIAALLLSAGPCFAGVVFEFETSDLTSPGTEPDTVHTVVDGKRIKIDVSGPRGAESDMVYHGDRREMMAVNHAEQTYVVIDQATIAEIGSRLQGLEAQMREAMKDVPPDQRAMVEQMMKQRMPAAAPAMPTYTVKKAGEKGEQNGLPCERFEILKDGELSKTVWVTDWDNVDGAREAAAAFDDLGDFIGELQAALPDFAKESSVGSNAYEHLDELGGFPVVTIDHAADGSVVAESRLTSSKSESVDAGVFEAPANYERLSIMQ